MTFSNIHSEIQHEIYSSAGTTHSHIEKPKGTAQQNLDGLNEEEKRKVQKLKKREAEIKAHEQAHKTTGGKYIRSAVEYEYEMGPDGKRYIVGGEVSIDVTPEKGDPEATIRKMQTVRKAALAPANPSKQDRAIAAEASRRENEARIELMKQKMSETENELPYLQPVRATTYNQKGVLTKNEFQSDTRFFYLVA